MLVVVIALLYALDGIYAAEDCRFPSTMVAGATPMEAIAYDEKCRTRKFRIRTDSIMDKGLNMTHLNLDHVQDYPRLYILLLGSNHLTTFRTKDIDNDMFALGLEENEISDLTSVRFPRRLTSLNLNKNRIVTLSAAPTTKWPEAMLLTNLTLDGNPIKLIDPDTFAAHTALQTLSLGSLNLSNRSQPIEYPSSLQILRLNDNVFDIESKLFVNNEPPPALRILDLSGNRFTAIPSVISKARALSQLYLQNNAIVHLDCGQLPQTLSVLQLDGNPLASIQVEESQLYILQQLSVFKASSTLLSTTPCPQINSRRVLVHNISVCVIPSIGTITPSSTTTNPITRSPGYTPFHVFLICIGCLIIGTLVPLLATCIRRHAHKGCTTRMKREGSGDWSRRSSLRLALNSCALLEERETTSSKRKKTRKNTPSCSSEETLSNIEADDLLVYEIPLEEIRMDARPLTTKSKSWGVEVVHRGQYQGYPVAMHALVRSTRRPNEGVERAFIERIRLASTLDHSSILQFIGVTLGRHSPLIRDWSMIVVFEWMPNGTLAQQFAQAATSLDLQSWFATLGSSSTSTLRCKLSIALDVAMGLAYLHSVGIVHGHLCADKVLLNEHGEAKLSPMDLHILMNQQLTSLEGQRLTQCRLPSYSRSTIHSISDPVERASEPTARTVVESRAYTQRQRNMKQDIYAFGLLLWELDTLCVAIPNDMDHELSFTNDCPEEIVTLAHRCRSPDPYERPSALMVQQEIARLLDGTFTMPPSSLPSTQNTRPSNPVSSRYVQWSEHGGSYGLTLSEVTP